MHSTPSNPANVVRVGRDHGPSAGTTCASVAIGFGSPSGDSGVARLDLNDILVKHPQATFLMRVAGDAMREIGIDAGKLVLVDRAITPAHGHVAIAVVDDEFLCRQLCLQGSNGLRLQAMNGGGSDIVAGEATELALWGVVTQVIKSMGAPGMPVKQWIARSTILGVMPDASSAMRRCRRRLPCARLPDKVRRRHSAKALRSFGRPTGRR
jgi:DNA polymerase V